MKPCTPAVAGFPRASGQVILMVLDLAPFCLALPRQLANVSHKLSSITNYLNKKNLKKGGKFRIVKQTIRYFVTVSQFFSTIDLSLLFCPCIFFFVARMDTADV